MRVLVTGASGTIGSRVCELLRWGGDEVVALGRNHGRLLENCAGCQNVTGDICDADWLSHCFKRYRPNAVIHAAANKHVGDCERNPSSAVSNNILGTLNVLRASAKVGAQRFIFVSTDKASNPLQVYGMSKYLSEMMVSEYRGDMKCNSVRFGNVMGSSGSVIPIWNAAIPSGKIVLRVDEKLNAAVRFVTPPRDAARFVTDVLNQKWSPGTTLLRPMEVIDIGVLAKCFARKFNVAIVYEPFAPGENIAESLISEQESSHCIHHPFLNVYEIFRDGTRRSDMADAKRRAEAVDPLSDEETMQFLNDLLSGAI